MPAVPTYQYVTLRQACTELAARLFDNNPIPGPMQLWPFAELTAYLTESLQVWNALTSVWRQEMAFPLLGQQVPGVPTFWYDLTQVPQTARPFTVTDNTLLQQIELSLLEPPTAAYPLVWSGSNQFNLDVILEALRRRRDETLGVTGCTLTRTLLTAQFVARQALPDNVIDIRRVAWIPDVPSVFSVAVLRQADYFSKQAYNPGYTVANQQPPRSWMKSAQPPLAFDVDYIPPVSGQYECLTVNAGPPLSSTKPTLLGVPDDWAWVIKWGALADLLGRESNAKDSQRADYAMRRFEQGLALMLNSPAVLAARINNVPCGVDSVRNGDDFGGWQRSTLGVPRGCYLAGLNLVAFGPTPIVWNLYGATLSVVQNAPVPSLPADYLQVSRDDYASILDESQHLACFKLGGQEFAATIPLHESFIKRAGLYNSKLSALGLYPKIQLEASQLEQERNPLYGELVPGGQNQ